MSATTPRNASSSGPRTSRATRVRPGRTVLATGPAAALGDDAAAQQHLPEAGSLLLEEGDRLQRQVEPELGGQAADLERADDPQRAVPAAAIAVGVAVRADSEHGLARRAVASHEI